MGEKSENVEYKLALKLVYELFERLRVVERNVEHLNNLVQFLSDYYREYYQKEKNLEKIVYEDYKRTLELMKEDIYDFQRFCRDVVCSSYYTYITKDSKVEKKDFFKLKYNLFESILYRGFTPRSSSKCEEFKEFIRQRTLKNTEIGNIFDIVIILRDLIEADVKPYTISLGNLNRAFACLAHSIEQSMSGLFIGNLIEHQPSVYTHKDLYHVMYYASLYCKGYNHSMRNLFSSILEINEKELFYEVSGINLQEENNDVKNKETGRNKNSSKNNRGIKIKYNIVFGDCTLPQLIDRYKLIALPIICAYRPRYWATLAHEVSHSYLQGLISCREIEKEILCPENENENSKTDKQKESTKVKVKNYIIDSLEYCAEMVASDRYLKKAFVGPITRSTKRDIYFIGASTEILADVFGFLLGGYAYIPALLSNIALGRPDVIRVQKLSYTFRMGVILALAEKFSKSKNKNRNILKVIIDRVNKLKDKSKIYQEICEGFGGSLGEVQEFIDAYTTLFTKCLRSEIPRRFMYLDYIFTFGSDLGKTLYDRYIINILKFILEKKDLYFGWIPSSSFLNNTSKYVILNILLNWKNLERFKEIKNSEDIKELDKILCHSTETIELYKWMKLIDWEVIDWEAKL